MNPLNTMRLVTGDQMGNGMQRIVEVWKKWRRRLTISMAEAK